MKTYLICYYSAAERKMVYTNNRVTLPDDVNCNSADAVAYATRMAERVYDLPESVSGKYSLYSND